MKILWIFFLDQPRLLCEDPVSAPKTIFKFAKENDKLSIIGGGLDGKTLSVDEVKQQASLPSLDELRASLLD